MVEELTKVNFIIIKRVKAVMTELKAFGNMDLLTLSRQLYSLNFAKETTAREKLQINRKLSKGYEKLANEEPVK